MDAQALDTSHQHRVTPKKAALRTGKGHAQLQVKLYCLVQQIDLPWNSCQPPNSSKSPQTGSAKHEGLHKCNYHKCWFHFNHHFSRIKWYGKSRASLKVWKFFPAIIASNNTSKSKQISEIVTKICKKPCKSLFLRNLEKFKNFVKSVWFLCEITQPARMVLSPSKLVKIDEGFHHSSMEFPDGGTWGQVSGMGGPKA